MTSARSQRERWKSFERRCAKMLGGKRVPVTGRGRGDAPDIEHDLYSLEVKHTARRFRFIEDAMSQAIASVRGDQVPVVVLGRPRQRDRDALVVMRLGDFAAHFGAGPGEAS